jgi:hypothetical protein
MPNGSFLEMKAKRQEQIRDPYIRVELSPNLFVHGKLEK